MDDSRDREVAKNWRRGKTDSFKESMRVHNIEVLDERPFNKACTPVEILCEQFNAFKQDCQNVEAEEMDCDFAEALIFSFSQVIL